jgi:hypothetical protein
MIELKRFTCEVGGDPAVDLLGTELSVGDDYGEDDEHGHGVLVVDAVGKVVVVPLDAEDEYGHPGHYGEDVHGATGLACLVCGRLGWC